MYIRHVKNLFMRLLFVSGLCAISVESVLTLDNATLNTKLPEQYTLAVADCSIETQFSVLVKKVPNNHVLVSFDSLFAKGLIIFLASNILAQGAFYV